MEGPKLFKKLLTAYSGLFFYAAPQTTWNSRKLSALSVRPNGTPGANAMPSGSAHEFEEFARDCVRLAEQADTQELREKLLNLAREWMRAVIEEEDTVMSRQAAE